MATATAVAALVAGAAAQDPGEALPDTDYTPRAKPTELWQHVAGAEFGKTATINAVTSFEVDFHEVAFLNDRAGLAGGSKCPESLARRPGESDAALGQRIRACVRVPAVYEYIETDEGSRWREMNLPGSDRPGYIGAIAWLDHERALAVGGEGRYPDREPNASEPDFATRAANDLAKGGRAWLYERGEWCELRPGADCGSLPPGTRGMTALDVHPTRGWGWAGALGQLIAWENGAFTQIVDRDSAERRENFGLVCPTPPGSTIPASPCGPGAKIAYGKQFDYRVREIVVMNTGPKQAFGVTAGCCGESPIHNVPRLLAYDGSKGTWFVRPFRTAVGEPVGGDPLDTTAGGGDGVTENSSLNPGRPNRGYVEPDSLYSLVAQDRGFGFYGVGAVATPGGPASPLDPASRIISGLGGTVLQDGKQSGQWFGINATQPTTTPLVSTGGARLLAGAGDDEPVSAQSNYRGNGTPDWAVGEQPSLDAGLGGRGLVVSTLDSLRPATTQAVDGVCADTACAGRLPTVDPQKAEQSLAARHFSAPTYRLMAVEMVGTSGEGWAVGAHGAILRLGVRTAASADEPPAPELGAAQAAEVPDRAAFDAYRRPPAARAGALPALHEQPADASATGLQPVAAGSPDPEQRAEWSEAARTIVMSRDGREGWALGPGGDGPERGIGAISSFYHYEGSRWSRCEPIATSMRPADRACAQLQPLLEYRLPNGSADPVRIVTAARVPLENDGNPDNDDDFEVVALGTSYRAPDEARAQPCTMLRYREGRWFRESPEVVAPIDSNGCYGELEFLAPDDGWLAGRISSAAKAYRYDGDRWMPCHNSIGSEFANVQACANQGPEGQRLPKSPPAMTANKINGLQRVGRRLYMYGSRTGPDMIGAFSTVSYPFVIYRDLGPCEAADPARQDGCWRASDGGLDPGFGKTDRLEPPTSIDSDGGEVMSLALAATPDGYEGWAIGRFGRRSNQGAAQVALGEPVAMRLADGRWSMWAEDDALRHYLQELVYEARPERLTPESALALGGGRAVLALRPPTQSVPTRFLSFDAEDDRWKLLRPNPFSTAVTFAGPAPDGDGGFWLGVVKPGRRATYMYRYTERVPRDVMADVPHPVVDRRITAMAAAADGSVWLGTDSSALYRYDRLTGWDRVAIPGWDAGRVVTRSSRVNAVAVGAGGSGLAVGEGGRIARLAGGEVRLDEAAGVPCGGGAGGSCGTTRELTAAAVAPRGSAMVGGRDATVLWRSLDGVFRRLDRPPKSAGATVKAIAMPSEDRAWLALDTGRILSGSLVDGAWQWRVENEDVRGRLLSLGPDGEELELRSIALDGDGRGYAVGEGGLVLERTGDGAQPWRRVATGYLDDFTAVALVPGTADAVVGGDHGLVLTVRDGHFAAARVADAYRPVDAPVLGLAVVPGFEEGQVEAWAVTAGDGRPGTAELLHHTNEPSERLLSPSRRARPLPDAPAPRPGEISFAAFGKSDCSIPGSAGFACPSLTGDNRAHERVIAGTLAALRARAGRGELGFAAFTGDAYDNGGDAATDAADRQQSVSGKDIPEAGAVRFRRFHEAVGEPLVQAGAPLFGAVGGQDLTEQTACEPNLATGRCVSTKQQVKAGAHTPWRRGMSDAAAPWGTGPTDGAGLSYEPVEPGRQADGARTHYAVDVVRDGVDVARLVVVDSSLRSLSAGDPAQNPVEPEGGQMVWLERMVCVEGTGVGCTRGAGQPAIVVSTTPTYSHGPGVATDTALDGVAFEDVLMRHGVSVVVSGRLGWNGRYWATAAGVHEPCPGGAHTDTPPSGPGRVCGTSTDGVAPGGGTEPLQAALADLGAPPPPDLGDTAQLGRLLPFVVAAGAGARFGPDGEGGGEASDGYWHGYSVVRVDRSGDPRGLIVEQRPVLDWITITAARRALRPGQRMTLRGVGREPIGNGSYDQVRFDRISSPAITHRYDLVIADPRDPSKPLEDANGDYVPVPAEVAGVDRQTGVVRAGRGRGERTYAVAILSVGEHAATYPMVFEPRRSFAPARARVSLPPLPRAARAPAAQPPVRLAEPLPPPPASPPANPVTPFTATTLQPPQPPQLLQLPAAGAPPVPGPPQLQAPPPPPTPPPPAAAPPSAQPAPLALSAKAQAISLVPSVNPPAPPPVNPAPPAGGAARKEAKQKQAAVAKSEEGEGGQGAPEGDGGQTRVNPGTDPSHGASRHGGDQYAFTRVEHASGPPAFTRVEHASGPSALVRGGLYTGGMAIAALLLAGAWGIGRPTQRHRRRAQPEAAPARARAQIRRP